MNTYRQHIGGEWADAADGGTWDVLNPATEEIVRAVPYGGAADCERAIDAAAAAFPAWAARTPYERGAVLKRAADLIRASLDDLGADHRARERQAAGSGARRMGGLGRPAGVVRRRRQARVRPDHPVENADQAADGAEATAWRRRRDHRLELSRLQRRSRRRGSARRRLHAGREAVRVHADDGDGPRAPAGRGGHAAGRRQPGQRRAGSDGPGDARAARLRQGSFHGKRARRQTADGRCVQDGHAALA